jgi:hypothetical protein
MAVGAGELAVGEAAFAAIGAADKLMFVQRCGQLRSTQARAAELALYRRQPAEAEALLLQVRGSDGLRAQLELASRTLFFIRPFMVATQAHVASGNQPIKRGAAVG